MPKSASGAASKAPSHGPSRAGAGVRCPSRERPVDLVHLARQTSGDRALEREILELFDRQLALLGDRLSEASGEEVKVIAHALCGTSRNVGAFTLADAARALEVGPGAEPACRTRLLSEMQRTRTFIQPLFELPDSGSVRHR